VDIRVFVLQVIDVSLLILTPLLLQDLDIFVEVAFVWAEQQEISFPRTLGIGDNDLRRDDGFHVDPPSLLLRYG